MNKNVITSVVLIGLLCVFSSSVFAQEYDNAADFLFERAQEIGRAHV